MLNISDIYNTVNHAKTETTGQTFSHTVERFDLKCLLQQVKELTGKDKGRRYCYLKGLRRLLARLKQTNKN